MITVGIDPGKTGFVAVILENGSVNLFPCPTIMNGTKREYDERSMAKIIKPFEIGTTSKVFIEKAQAMRKKGVKQGVVSVFSFGMGYGLWLGILASHNVSYQTVSPKRWQGIMLADIPGKDTKARAVIAAKRLFPQCSDWERKDHNRADALLIAEWGRRQHK